MTRHYETRLRQLLQIWMVCFLSAEVFFLFFGNALLEAFNRISIRITPYLMLLPPSHERFWMVLTTSLMITLVFLCYWGQKDIRRNHFVVVPILVSKFTSTFFFFVFFLFHLRSLAYFIGALVDGSIFIITYYFYRAYRNELSLNGGQTNQNA